MEQITQTVLAHRSLVVSSLSVLAVGLAACGGSSSVSSLNAAGASFPAKVYQSWFAELAGSGGIKVNYQAVGSGSGRKAFIDQTVNFGASDDPMKKKDMAKVSRGVVQIPMVGGTIAFGYNKPGCELQLTQQQAVEVATGAISDWKDLGCEAGTITWVHRSDGSGTTKAFTNSMQTFSPDWTLGSGKSVKWPVGVGAKGNSGVAGVIENREGAIGYVNQSYIKGNVKAAAVQNKSGEFLQPSVEAGAKALNGIELDQYLAGSNPNPEAAGAYPIATLTWVLAYKTGNGKDAKVVQDAFNYMLSDAAQNKAPSLGFVPLKGDILAKSKAAVKKIGK
ncbi:MAG: phosphate ABC transporter substrate-binding protein PstS [Synechococcus sp.]